MLNLRKTAVLTLTSSTLYFALISPNLLADVTLYVKDAIIITFFVITANLTSRYIGLQEKRKLENRIIIQHSQMLAIINSMPVVMYLKDIKGKILLANQGHSDMFGLHTEELTGKYTSELYRDYDICKKEDEEIIRSKSRIEIERLVETSRDTTQWCRVIKSPVFDDSGEVVNIAVLFQNIDNEKVIEERKNTFIATLTHDLKTPTISQIKALDLLLERNLGPLNEAQEEIITQIKSSCNYMYDLIFTILDTYLYDNGQTKISYDEFDLTGLINETSGELSNLLVEKGQKIVLYSNLQSKIVSADRFQIKRVIVNLISNAITYGYAHSDIEVTLDENEADIAINIKNKASYIPREKLMDMYEKFKTTSDAKFGKTGVGLGLYLSKQIVDAHRGRVYANSSPDDTCTFGFSIPKTPQKTLSAV